MPDLLQKIKDAAKIGEESDWEFKSAKGGLPGTLWETYSAFANADGGSLVLGAKEVDDGTIKLEGIPEDKLAVYEKQIWDILNNRGKVSRNLLGAADVQRVSVGKHALLVLHVRRAARGERPVYLNGQPLNNTFRRDYEGDYHCTEEEVRRMFADADATPADARILENFSLEDLDRPSLTQYRQRFRAAKGEHPWLGLEDRELLEKLGGWRRDRQSGNEGITVAGLLMFGKDQAIRDPSAAPGYFVDYREKLDPNVRWTDRIYPDGTWVANLFQFYTRVWPKLAAGLSTPFEIEGGQRRDDTAAHEALREAFVNAMIHADYSAPGGVVVERLGDRFHFENPGTLLLSRAQIRRGGVSECRNKSLQQMFLMVGGGEKAGSGVDKIRAGWKSRHWRPPFVTEHVRPDRVQWVLPMLSLLPPEAVEAVSRVIGRPAASLPATELQTLASAWIEGGISNSRLQELMDIHPADISRLLRKLCQRGDLESDNRRRWAFYQLAGDSQHKEPNSQHKEPSSQHKEPNSTHNGPNSQRLKDIALPVAKTQRSDPEQTKRVILELCRERFLTISDLSDLLNRNSAGLRERFIGPMVKAGLLRPKYPLSSNNPNQAYTTAEEEEVP